MERRRCLHQVMAPHILYSQTSDNAGVAVVVLVAVVIVAGSRRIDWYAEVAVFKEC